MIRLTEHAQRFVEQCLQFGQSRASCDNDTLCKTGETSGASGTGLTVIDATAGNGHDTCFLAQAVGRSGCVYAFDIQPEALQRTAALLESRRLHNVVLCCTDHAAMASVIPESLHGQIAAVMFNLGYLPGGDQQRTTRTASTLAALAASLRLLRTGGVLTVVAYPGHSGGADETQAVDEFLRQLDAQQYQVQTVYAESPSPTAPRLFVAASLETQA